MDHSEKTEELATALAKAQGEFPAIHKNQEVEVKKEGRLLYKFRYADLTQIIDHIRPVLAKNGLSFTQRIIEGFYITKIFHSSGQWIITGHIPININDRMGMKDIAGACTYGKRLSLSSAFGVSADEDVDAPSEHGESIDKKGIDGSYSRNHVNSTTLLNHNSIAEGYNPNDYFEAFPPDEVPEVKATDMFPGLKIDPSTLDRKFNVGKHKGKKFSEVNDPSYISWVKSEVDHNLAKCGPDLKEFYAYQKEKGVIK